MHMRVARMIADESGSVTIWNLFWFLVMAAFFGLAMDTNSAIHKRAQLQSTSDASAIAGIYQMVPTEVTTDEAAGRQAARDYAALNLDVDQNGNFLKDEDIVVGRWDFDTETIVPDATPLNAIQVSTRRESASGNPLVTTFLRVIQFYSWDISSTAVAVAEFHQCELDGLISMQQIRMEGGNFFFDHYCVYGRSGVEVVNNNDFTGVANPAFAGYGRGFTAPCGFYLLGKQAEQCYLGSNPGLEEAWFVSDAIYPTRILETDADGVPVRDANGDVIVTLDDQIADWVTASQDPLNNASVMEEADWRTGGSGDQPNGDVANALQLGGYFNLRCDKDGNILGIPPGDYTGLTLVTNCLLRIEGSGGGTDVFDDVVFVSTSSKSFASTRDYNIEIHGGNQLGTDCSNPGHLARFFTMSGVWLDGGVIHKGGQINAGGDVFFSGGNDGADPRLVDPSISETDKLAIIESHEYSLTVHALGNIEMTSTSNFGLCGAPIGGTANARASYRLVQ